MRNLAVLVLLLAMVGLNTAYRIDGMYGNQFYDDDDAAGMFPEHKRQTLPNSDDLCIPWRAPCPKDSSLAQQYNFLRCCTGLACKCAIWGNNCKCVARMGR